MEYIDKLLKELDDGTVPSNVLTVGRLVKNLLNFRPNIPVVITNGNDTVHKYKVLYIGASPNDDVAWAGEVELPRAASKFEIFIKAVE